MKIETLEKKLSDLCEKREVMTQEIVALNKKLKAMRTKTLALDPEHITPEIYMSVRNIDQYDSSVYRILQDWLQNNYVSRGVYACGQVGYDGQRFLKLMFDQNKPFEEQLGIIDFLPYMDYNYLGIFDDTLSAGGIYELHDINTKPRITKTTYGRTRDEKQFETLNGALKYVYDHLPYERKKQKYKDATEFDDLYD